MQTDLSLLKLFIDASLLVQLVMLLLLLTSLFSWVIIFRKQMQLKATTQGVERFEQRFWASSDLGQLYHQSTHKGSVVTGLELVFVSGFKEFSRQRKQTGVEPGMIVEGAQRSMRAALGREIDDLEQHLSLLATVGSTSPYVGLFGTVWGIMNSFRALGNVHNATLALVAPGIAEALIATAMGLLAAIPAVVAYNYYANEVERLINRYTTFAEEFTIILQRQAHL